MNKLERKKIMVVEDEIDNLNIIGTFLEFCKKYPKDQVVLVNGVMGATMALARYSFDIVLTDFNLLDGTAIDVLRAIRSQAEDSSETKVIVMSGLFEENMSDFQTELFHLRPFLKFKKPIDIERLKKELE